MCGHVWVIQDSSRVPREMVAQRGEEIAKTAPPIPGFAVGLD